MVAWLVVEDEPGIYEMLQALVRQLNVDDISFTTGEDAIDWIEAYEKMEVPNEPPKVALLDIRLPGKKSGIDVGASLRKSPLLGNIVIVMTTAYRLNSKEEAKMMKTAGADWLAYKPLPPVKEFSVKINELLKARSSKTPESSS